MFIAALFTIAKSWEQPKCPSTDEWIKKMWYIYTMEYYSAIKRNKDADASGFLCCAKDLSFIRSYLFIFVFISITLGGGSKRILL